MSKSKILPNLILEENIHLIFLVLLLFSVERVTLDRFKTGTDESFIYCWKC